MFVGYLFFILCVIILVFVSFWSDRVIGST